MSATGEMNWRRLFQRCAIRFGFDYSVPVISLFECDHALQVMNSCIFDLICASRWRSHLFSVVGGLPDGEAQAAGFPCSFLVDERSGIILTRASMALGQRAE